MGRILHGTYVMCFSKISIVDEMSYLRCVVRQVLIIIFLIL